MHVQNESEWHNTTKHTQKTKRNEIQMKRKEKKHTHKQREFVYCFHGRENNNERYEIYINIR